jgi:hypothetical protein
MLLSEPRMPASGSRSLARRLPLLVGAEFIVCGVSALMSSLRLSETFLGMAVVGVGESVEETARMVPAARRGHPELAWGNACIVLVAWPLLTARSLGCRAGVFFTALYLFYLVFNLRYMWA